MRWPLQIQIFVPLGILILVVLAVVSGLNAYLAARQCTARIERQIAAIADSMRASNYPLTDSILRQTRSLSGAEFIVADETGSVVAASLHAPARFAASTAATPTNELHLLPTVTVAGEHYFHTKVRTQRAPRLQPQWLHILYPERVWRQARWQAAYPPLLVGAAALAVVFALSMTLAGRLSLPIRQLQTQVSRIAQGHFAPMPLPRRHDELRDLIASVNALVRDLVCLSQAIKRSERLALMGQLSGGLAHHLRNAIAGAKLALQLHQRHCHQGDPESLAVAQRQLQLTEEQLQRFLSAGQPPVPSPDRTELPALVAEVARLVAPMCQHRRVVWQVQLGATTLPEVRVDRLQVHEALLNLVLNAIEAAGPDGWVRVESAPADNGQLVLRVLDSGPGPPPELRSRLFEPFVTGKPEGIGLGLAATKQIAEAHGGTLRFVEGRPTCFELALPVAEGHPAATDRPAVAEESRPRNNDDKTREASGRGITNTE